MMSFVKRHLPSFPPNAMAPKVWTSDSVGDSRSIDVVLLTDLCLVIFERDRMLMVLTPRMRVGWVFSSAIERVSG